MYMDIDALTAIERWLFNHGILSVVIENNDAMDYTMLVRFASGLIYRICIDCVFPRRNIRLETMPPLLLFESAFRHMSPSQLRIKLMAWNLRGPAEHMFQIELYSAFRDCYPGLGVAQVRSIR